MKVGNWFWNFRFSQPSVWGFGSPGTWCCVRSYRSFKQTWCLYCRV